MTVPRSRRDEAGVDVTVVLPCHNEAGHIHTEADRITTALRDAGLAFELLIVDDGSTDTSRTEIDRVAAGHREIRILRNQRRAGSGAARQHASRNARGRVIVWTDCDMTYPNERIPELVQLLDSDAQLSQAIGARSTEEGTHPHLRTLAKRIISALVWYRTGQTVPDLNSGMRAFYSADCEFALRQLPAGFSCTTTMTLAYMMARRTITYLPIDYQRRAGRSKFNPIGDTYKLIRQVRTVTRQGRNAAQLGRCPATLRVARLLRRPSHPTEALGRPGSRREATGAAARRRSGFIGRP